MIGDYDPDGVVFPHIQVPIFKVCIYLRISHVDYRRPSELRRIYDQIEVYFVSLSARYYFQD